MNEPSVSPERSNSLRTAVRLFLALTVLTGVAYPLLVTGIAQAGFSRQANGSLLLVAGRPVGSSLVGQTFTGERYFWSRPSAVGYNAGASSGANLGPTNPALEERVAADVARLRQAHPERVAEAIPADLATASSSGLDPHVSPAGALFQVERVARARGLSPEAVRQFVEGHVERRTFGLLGEPRVNVLELNVALDQLKPPDPIPSGR
jgi:K+-transporting ATPase ATPase C chain